MISIGTSIITCLKKVSNMLFWIYFILKLLKFGRLITCRHFEVINSSSVWLSIHMRRLGGDFILIFDSAFNKLFQAIEWDHSFRRN
ncbi:hypothetical protein RDI58_010204 [Solanum bulbocastanum]|uniref:Uncharacterized protein n=1 Tax=Solanum bulbocastanum TaxID=147425 RepID=A0AAN8TUK2_SOLBU